MKKTIIIMSACATLFAMSFASASAAEQKSLQAQIAELKKMILELQIKLLTQQALKEQSAKSFPMEYGTRTNNVPEKKKSEKSSIKTLFVFDGNWKVAEKVSAFQPRLKAGNRCIEKIEGENKEAVCDGTFGEKHFGGSYFKVFITDGENNPKNEIVAQADDGGEFQIPVRLDKGDRVVVKEYKNGGVGVSAIGSFETSK